MRDILVASAIVSGAADVRGTADHTSTAKELLRRDERTGRAQQGIAAPSRQRSITAVLPASLAIPMVFLDEIGQGCRPNNVGLAWPTANTNPTQSRSKH